MNIFYSREILFYIVWACLDNVSARILRSCMLFLLVPTSIISESNNILTIPGLSYFVANNPLFVYIFTYNSRILITGVINKNVNKQMIV